MAVQPAFEVAAADGVVDAHDAAVAERLHANRWTGPVRSVFRAVRSIFPAGTDHSTLQLLISHGESNREFFDGLCGRPADLNGGVGINVADLLFVLAKAGDKRHFYPETYRSGVLPALCYDWKPYVLLLDMA